MAEAITLRDILPLHVYRARRDEYVATMIEYKRDRRIKLSEYISILFENRQTVLFQIQELSHCEDLTDERELHEYIDIYSGMLPADDELSATLFIELDDQKRLEEVLVTLKGIEHHLFLKVGDETVKAVFEEVHDDREFTTSVHYLKFPLTNGALSYLQSHTAEATDLTIILNHPSLSAEVKLPVETVKSLQADLTSES